MNNNINKINLSYQKLVQVITKKYMIDEGELAY